MQELGFPRGPVLPRLPGTSLDHPSVKSSSEQIPLPRSRQILSCCPSSPNKQSCWSSQSFGETTWKMPLKGSLPSMMSVVSECQHGGWRVACLTIEFGGRSKDKRHITEVTERASRWLWMKRGMPWSQAVSKPSGQV